VAALAEQVRDGEGARDVAGVAPDARRVHAGRDHVALDAPALPLHLGDRGEPSVTPGEHVGHVSAKRRGHRRIAAGDVVGERVVGEIDDGRRGALAEPAEVLAGLAQDQVHSPVGHERARLVFHGTEPRIGGHRSE
jgi:hypothetical protein